MVSHKYSNPIRVIISSFYLFFLFEIKIILYECKKFFQKKYFFERVQELKVQELHRKD